jgi:hypothetical protein
MRHSTRSYGRAAALLALILGGCAKSSAPTQTTEVGLPSREAYTAPPTADASDAARAENHGVADCTHDCSGQEAGYMWAWEHNITDETACSGNSVAFIAGCQAYAHQQEEQHSVHAEP